jgi:hypothetical protein
MAEAGDITAQLKLPLGPFVYLMSVLCAVTGLVHAVHVFRPLGGGAAAEPADGGLV